MRVLNNTRSKDHAEVRPYPRIEICDECKSELEYDESDIYMGEYGCMYVTCPVCQNHVLLEDNEHSVVVTEDNISFPIHFAHSSKETGAYDCCNKENVRKYVKRAIEYLRKHPDSAYWYTSTGNLCLFVQRHDGDDEYFVTVSNDYYDTFIPYTEYDYI